MSEKTKELMKKILEDKKAASANQSYQKPNRKIGHSSTGHNSQKNGGAKKV